ncbi:TVP38/TMEM64 family protein [Haliangium sp.]|uniref:TVP38/TMEM64 family protein n=1 Tax=Haliangium sp. TaxID=2663208 RepID=UPI003D12EEC3
MKWLIGTALALFGLFTCSFLFFESLGYLEPEFIGDQVSHLLHAHGRWLAAVTIVGLLVSDLFLPVPASIVMTLSGYYFGISGALWNFVGAMGGALLGFWLCRRFGRDVMRRRLAHDDIAPIERFFASYGAWAILLSRAVPMVTEVVSCLAGLSSISGRRFAALSALGVLPLCVLYAWAGGVSEETSSAWAFWLAVLIPAVAFAGFRALTHGFSKRTRQE